MCSSKKSRRLSGSGDAWGSVMPGEEENTEICRPSGCTRHVQLPMEMTSPGVVKVDPENYFIFYRGNAWMFNNRTLVSIRQGIIEGILNTVQALLKSGVPSSSGLTL